MKIAQTGDYRPVKLLICKGTLNIRTSGRFRSTFLETIDGAELISGRAVLFLLGDGGEVGDVVLGGHGDAAEPDASEGRVAIDERVVLGVDVDEIEGARVRGEVGLDVAKEAAQETVFKGMKEVREDGLLWQRSARGVSFVEHEWREQGGLLRIVPESDVVARNGGEIGVELDAFDAEERILGCDEHGAAFAGADVEEDGAVDGGLRMQIAEP